MLMRSFGDLKQWGLVPSRRGMGGSDATGVLCQTSPRRQRVVGGRVSPRRPARSGLIGSRGANANHSLTGIAMTSLCRTIEINLKQCLGAADLPATIEPVHGVL